MAEFIALLLSTVSSLLASGQSDTVLAAAIEKAIVAEREEIGELNVVCSGVRAGHVDRITLELEELLLDPLVVDAARITVEQVSLAADGRLDLGDIEWTATIGEDDLTSALRGHVDTLADASIAIDEDELQLAGTYPFLRMKMPYEIAGRLKIENATELVFRVERSGLSGLSMPGNLNKLIEKEINPVYDLADFASRNEDELNAAKLRLNYEFKLNVDSITNGDGHIIVVGDA